MKKTFRRKPGARPSALQRPRNRLELLESPSRFGSILANSVDVLYRRNLRTDQYDYVSPSVLALTGYTPREFTSGGLRSTLDRIHPDDLRQSQGAVAEVMRNPDGHGRAVYRYRRKDGVYRWFSDYYTVIRDAKGRPRYWVGTVRDVTDLKRAEESLKRSRRQLEATVKFRTAQLRAMTAKLIGAEEAERERIGQILHEDLQQILVWLRYAIEAPAAGRSPRHTKQLLGIVDRAIHVARSLSRDLLPPLAEEESLREGLARLAGDMRQRFGLVIQLRMAHATEPKTQALRVFIFRAVSELLLNIVKHAGSRTAQLRIGISDENWIRVDLRDRGRGFNVKGLRPAGLGLFRIRERAVHFGGDLQVVSTPGGGTRILLTLPKC